MAKILLKTERRKNEMIPLSVIPAALVKKAARGRKGAATATKKNSF